MITKEGRCGLLRRHRCDTARQDWEILFCKIGKADYLDNLQTVELYHARLYTPLAIDFHVFVSGAVLSSSGGGPSKK